MYVCICNQITDSMLKDKPELIKVCGTKCGKCLEWIAQGKIPGTDITINNIKREQK